MKKFIEAEMPAKLSENDVVCFCDGKWQVMNKVDFLANVYNTMNEKEAKLVLANKNANKRIDFANNDIKATNAKIDELQNQINELKKNINIKLKEHHDVLNTLTGGNK